jgi:hypothetical protein
LHDRFPAPADPEGQHDSQHEVIGGAAPSGPVNIVLVDVTLSWNRDDPCRGPGVLPENRY